ncbi:hypothetical protein CDD82_7841 [Ophiocordyceps australis]|uniref:Calcineurin-like phosphoesterase domain-containing protein n=1 Tax=Ophiocordyceps australis TaxID=1399860 RepID=A0A2C5Y1N3_9HYPO|nr:hypothetical protein CDD82_7841 [Ophiocordyceps australis]
MRNLLTASLLATAGAIQPGAEAPAPAPMRNLSWGQLNFLHTTDTHGWLAGHLQQSQYSADWGDYISFAHHLRQRADKDGVDLLLVDSGDRVDGNGLYDASSPKGLYSYDIFNQQDMDVICVGNHELYQQPTAEHEYNTTVPHFKDSYLASNVDYIDATNGKRKPLAKRYRRFRTKNLGINVVAMGFLFDFKENANNTVVTPVADALKEPWFEEAMSEKPDVFVVVAHIGVRMEELRAIFTALRKENWHIPILLFGGHVHVRDALQFDSQSIAIDSGRYLETIGWVSVDGLKLKGKGASSAASLTLGRKYIDNNLLGMYHHTGLNESTFATDHGKNVTAAITHARKALDLDRQYGCAPRSLWMNRVEFPSKDSIYSWLQDDVLPAKIVNETRKDTPRFVIVNTGGIRFDIAKGAITRDTILTTSPFANKFVYVADVPLAVAQKVLPILNSASKIFNLDTRLMTIAQQRYATTHSSRAGTGERLELRGVLQPHAAPGVDGQEEEEEPPLVPGYTTKDDIGTDGDDTVRAPLESHPVPNCVQAEIGLSKDADKQPEAVDLVFVDYVQRWIIPALEFSGGDFTDANVRPYMDDTLAQVMTHWVQENWSEC